jgi:outer membrane receptor for ferrienterochelin and colicins
MPKGHLLLRAVLSLMAFGLGPCLEAQVSSVYGSLHVSIVDPTGAVVPNATVGVHLPSRNWRRQILTGSAGDAYFPALVPGGYGVTVEAPNFARQEASITPLLGHEVAVEIVLRLEGQPQEVSNDQKVSTPPPASQGATVTGRVVDEDGKPVAAVTIRIDELTSQTLTNQEGMFRFDNLPARVLTLVVISSDRYYTGQKTTVDLSAGSPITVDIQLTQREKLRSSIVVTGTRTEHLAVDAPVRTDLIPESFLRREVKGTLAEALTASVPGVRVENNCQNCGVTAVRLNGLEGNYTQILEDGLPTMSSVSMVYALDQIPAEFLQSIEIIKGGASALYGPNAVGGVINLIRREPHRNFFRFDSQVGWQYGRPEQSIGLTGRTPKLPAGLLGDFYFRGINRVAIDRDRDGFTELPKRRLFGGGGTLNHHFFQGRGQLTFGGSALEEHRRGGDHLDLLPEETFVTEMIDSRRSSGFLRWRHSTSASTYYTLATSLSYLRRNTYYGTNFDPHAYGNTRNPLWATDAQIGHQAGPHTLMAGFQFWREQVQDDVPSYHRSFNQVFRNTGFYFQDEFKLKPRVTIVAGLRADKSSTLRNWAASPRGNIRIGLGDNWILRFGASTGFRAPQIFDEDLHIMAVGGEGSVIENSPKLRKEAAWSWTGALDYIRDVRGGHLQAGANFFSTNLNDVFVLEETPVPGGDFRKFLRVNGAGSHVRGVEFDLNWRINRNLVLRGGSTFQQARYQEPEPVFGSLRYFRAPNRYGFASMDLFLPHDMSMFATANFTGSMLVPHYAGCIPEDRLQETPKFAVYNIVFSRAFHLGGSSGNTRRMRWYVKVSNLFDAYQHELDRGPLRDAGYFYGPMSMRTLTLGMTMTF